MTSFTGRLEEYIAFRRRCGGDWSTAAKRVRPFAAFADAEGAEWITVNLFLRWKDAFGSASTATWADRLSAVRGFAAWLTDSDPRTEIPPKGLVPKRYRRPRPYIYSDDEIVRIVTEAAALPSRLGLRSVTCATLFGLLAVTGMRIGEAIGLDDGDVDVDAAVLHVRHAKNGKDRFVPVTDCTNRYLGEYRAARDRILESSTTAAFFAGENGRRLRLLAAQRNFARVGQKIGLRQKQIGNYHGLGPRLHDLRHSFASKTILDWFRQGRDPDREMYKLSTYLGHANPAGTWWYIEAVPELLKLASERAEQAFREGEGS